MTDLMIHTRGAKKVAREELDLIQLPKATDSYVPVSHYHLADRILTVSQDILRDYALVGENYGIARYGNQLFAVLNFKANDNNEMGLSVGFRNSYDRSMSIGLAIGASVFVCDNLAFNGEITVMRKHTKNVWDRLEDVAITTLYKAQKKFRRIVADAENLKRQQVDDDHVFQILGLLFGHNVLGPRQLTVAKNHWLKPPYQEFKPRNAWSMFNSVTESLKSAAPPLIMEKHAKAYEMIVEPNKSF